jgi:EAL domain-containing protein (putative c-di-GMP-specific phosphodiesterase class I)/GGDEF domain-containing protein
MKKSQSNREQALLYSGPQEEERAAFLDAVRQLLQAQVTYVFLCLEVERFFTIWEQFGPEEGEALSQTVEKVLEERLQGQGISISLGGGAFWICMPYEKRGVQALMSALQERVAYYPLPFRVQLRFGLCLAEVPEVTPEELKDRALLAMRTVERQEKKRYAFYEETLRQQQLEIQEMRYEMQAALVDGQFDIFLQPKYDMLTGSIFGAEALVRWIHPKKGMRLPETFVPVFERYGLIFQLDSFVWEQVCRLLRKQLDTDGTALPISVNLSKVDLYHPDLCQILCRLTERYGLDPALLELELPGDAYEAEPDQVLRTVKDLKEKGFSIWLGQCEKVSLQVLQALPLDGIKLSLRAFSNRKQEGTRETRLFASVVRMAQWLHLPVTAVGVEKKWQAEFLRSIGCTRAQGFHYARPMNRAQYRDLVGLSFNTTQPEQIGQEQAELMSLLEQDTPLNLLFSNGVEGMALYEWRGEFPELIRANDAYLSLLDGDPAALREEGRDAFGRMREEDQQQFLTVLRQAQKSGRPAKGVFGLQTKRETSRQIQMKARCLLAGEGWALFYVSGVDITERTALERKNVKMAETLRALLDTLPIGIGLFEADEKELEVSYANKAYCQMLGYSKREYQAAADHVPHLLLPEKVAKRLRHDCVKAFHNGTVWEDAYGAWRKDGSPCAISLRFAPLPGQLGKRVFCAVCTQRPDLLDRVELPPLPERKETPEPPKKERGWRLRKKTELATFLSDQRESKPASVLSSLESGQQRAVVLPLGQARDAMELAAEEAQAGSVQALLMIEYETALEGTVRDQAEQRILEAFPSGIIGRISARGFLIWQRDTSADEIRGQVALLYSAKQKTGPDCHVGIAYATPPLPPLTKLLEQAMEGVFTAKTMGTVPFVEAHPEGEAKKA